MEEKKRAPYSSKVTAEEFSQNPDVGIYSYLHILRNRKGTLAACISVSLFLAFFVNLTQKPVYRASTELILQPKDSKTASTPSGASFMSDPTFFLTQDRLIQGPRLAERVLKKLELPENREALLDSFGIHPSRKRKDPSVFSQREQQALIGAIQRSLATRQVQNGARIFALSATGYRPEMVARIANAASEGYIQINYESHIESFRQSFGLISKTLAEIREKIKTGEMAFQKIDSEVQLLEALKVYGERHPLVIELRRKIPELTRKLQQGVQNLETMEISQRKDLKPLLMRPNTTLEDLQKIEADLYTLKPILEQEMNSNKEMYSSIFRRLQEVEVSGGSNTWMDVELVEPAGVPHTPIRPNKKMNLIIGFVVGLSLGIGFAFFQEYLDSSVRSLEDVRSYLKLFPLGMVPQVLLTIKGNGNSEGEKVPMESVRDFWLANDSDIPLYVSEAYRIIRTNLAFGSVDTSLRVLQVTSAVKGEGKTTTAANLAISLALTGTRTLIVDADMRRPALHRILGLGERGLGLSEALTNGKSWESAVLPTSTPHLYFLSAGTTPPNPSELLSSKKMKDLLEELKKNFDMVIFDSPPVISVADSAILASRVDGTIFVSRAGFIPRHLCLQAKMALESVNGKVVGCVLNSVQNEHQPYYYHQYYQEYARYGEGENGGSNTNKLPDGWIQTVEKVGALKEPFLILLSKLWATLPGFLKWQSAKKESKSSIGA